MSKKNLELELANEKMTTTKVIGEQRQLELKVDQVK